MSAVQAVKQTVQMLGKRLVPLGDRVLIERFVPQTTTKGGIMLPEKAQEKVKSGTVLAVGPGRKNEKTGELDPPQVKEGDRVLLPEYGGTKVELEDKELYIFRDSEILGKWTD